MVEWFGVPDKNYSLNPSHWQLYHILWAARWIVMRDSKLLWQTMEDLDISEYIHPLQTPAQLYTYMYN